MAQRTRTRHLTASAAITGADLVAALIWLALWDRRMTNGALIWAAVLALIPFAISSYYLSWCGAWLVDGSRRCRHRRKGFGRRCGSHGGFNLYDLVGGAAFLVAAAVVAEVLFLNR